MSSDELSAVSAWSSGSGLCRLADGLELMRPGATLEPMLSRLQLRFSHVGRRPVVFEPSSVSIISFPAKNSISSGFKQTPIKEKLVVKGPLGELSFPIHQGLKWSVAPGHVENESQITIQLDDAIFDNLNKYNRKFVRSMWGTTTSGINRMVEGVCEGFQVSLRLVGVGYKAALEPERGLVMKLGYSHDVVIPLPSGIKATCPSPTRIVLSGIDYHKLTQFAAFIRSHKKPEPYNGKGIFVGNETIALKEGKKK